MMRKVRLSAIQIKLGTTLILLSILFASNVAFADIILSPEQKSWEYKSYIETQIFVYGFIILMLGLASLLLIKVIRKVIIKTTDMKNNIQVKKIICESVLKNRKSSDNIDEDKSNEH